MTPTSSGMIRNINIFINGINTSFDEAKNECRTIKQITGHHCDLFYNEGHLLTPQTKEYKEKKASELGQTIFIHLQNTNSDVNLIAHSQGTHIVEKTMKRLKEYPDICRRINVVFLGGVSNLNRDSGKPTLYFDIKDSHDHPSNVVRIGRVQWFATPILVDNNYCGFFHHCNNGYLKTKQTIYALRSIAFKNVRRQFIRETGEIYRSIPYDVHQIKEVMPNLQGLLVEARVPTHALVECTFYRTYVS